MREDQASLRILSKETEENTQRRHKTHVIENPIKHKGGEVEIQSETTS
jgi:hypothetical protein